jgi:hypothetical protein
LSPGLSQTEARERGSAPPAPNSAGCNGLFSDPSRAIAADVQLAITGTPVAFSVCDMLQPREDGSS